MRYLMALFTSLMISMSANAGLIYFDQGVNGASEFTQAVDDISLTFFKKTGAFVNNGDGIELSDSWSVVTDKDILFSYYVIDWAFDGLFDITGLGVKLEAQSSGRGPNDFSDPLIFLADETYTFTSVSGFVEFESFGVSQYIASVPEPSSALLLLLALVGFRKNKTY